MACKVLIAGCGDLGCAVAERLNQEDFEVYGLRYSNKSLPSGVKLIQADVTQPSSLRSLESLTPEILLYCVAASAQTDESYQAHYVDGLHNVLNFLAPAASLKHVFFVSSTRVYGQQTDELLDEASPAIPADFGGERLLEAEALLKTTGCLSTVLRLSGIYGHGRTRMLRLARQPEQWPQQDSWTNRIHRDDAASFIAFLLECVRAKQAVQDCYVVTDSQPVSQYEVLMWLAGQLGVNLNQIKPPAIKGGKRLSNRRMLGEGFSLLYPDYRIGYSSLLGD
ncbi:MAG TPA: SDR family oxidoreductase [Methylophilaceae bacterium]|jgi:nucleoside-diphosphate-sugar epimerase